MKKIQKIIAIILTVLLVSTLALPTVAFAATQVDDEHQTPDDFYDQVTDDDNNIDWDDISVGLFIPTFFMEMVEAIINAFRSIINQFMGFFATLIPDPDEFLPEIPECPVEEEVSSELAA